MAQDDRQAAAIGQIDAEALKKADEFIEQDEGATSKFAGRLAVAVSAIAVFMSLFHLYVAVAGSWPLGWAPIVATQETRYAHVGFILVLCFLLFPVAPRFRHRLMWWDLVLAAVSIVILAYAVLGGDDFTDRNTLPDNLDIFFGCLLILFVLEVTRRSSGWIMPAVVVAFILYALAGPYLPPPWTHKGYDLGRLTGHMYMTLEGIFGTAIDVSSSLIILFTIYGAILQFSGAGKFFIDFSFALMGGKATGAGRTIVLASFLLGGPSGSGVATTVTLGSVAYPMLAKAGYEKHAAGGLLAAGGLGAILSPPVLGAAAFLIAEFLKISYLDVIWMATIPTCLYYLALFAMAELDVRKYAMHEVPIERGPGMWALTRKYGFHFSSLIGIVVFMLLGFSPTLAVFWATVLAFAVSFFNRETALVPAKLWKALEAGSVGMLNVGATCASAGIIVGVVTLTGLGLKFSSIVIDYAGGSLLLTALYTALIVWIVGLAVPVTASYIICAVIAAPALIKLGVPDYAAHMFIFYYAVLSEVSPPTALSPFAAAAITGGDPYKTTLQSWKYTMPAFIVPFAFVLEPEGVGLLLKIPKGGDWMDIVQITTTTLLGIGALAAGLQGWLLRKTSAIERTLLIVSGFLFVMPEVADVPIANLTGHHLVGAHFIAAAAAIVAFLLQRARPAARAA